MINDFIKNSDIYEIYNNPNWINIIKKPWKLSSESKKIVINSKLQISKKARIESEVTIIGEVSIGENTTITGSSYIIGPVIIGKNCVLGPNCFIRPYSIIGDNTTIGYNCYVTNSIIGNNSGIYHLCGIGRSIIGNNVLITSFVQLSSTRLSQENIFCEIDGKLIDTQLNKFGCIIGNNTRIGSHASILAGRFVGNNCIIGSRVTIANNIPNNKLVTLRQELLVEDCYPKEIIQKPPQFIIKGEEK